MENETLDIIKRRRSNREFTDEQLTKEELDAILDAGLSAPFGSTHYRHFAAIQNKKVLEALNHAAKWVATTNPVEHLAELGHDESFDCTYGAPTLVIVSAKEDSISPAMDSAAALENMLIAAESLGLGSCWIYFVVLAFEGNRKNEFMKKLHIPEGYRSYGAVALGHKVNKKVLTATRSESTISRIS